MKIRIQNSNEYLDVDIEHPYRIGEPEIYEAKLKPKLQDLIDNKDLKCDGCGKSLIGRGWLCIYHRPKSALSIGNDVDIETKDYVYGEGDFELKDIWAMFFICSDTSEHCIKKWVDRRPR